VKIFIFLALAVGMAIFGIVSFYKISDVRRVIQLVRASAEGAMPQDGKISAAVGIIHARWDPLNAPFSERNAPYLNTRSTPSMSGGSTIPIATSQRGHYVAAVFEWLLAQFEPRRETRSCFLKFQICGDFLNKK
jgi:hypothetical protein